MGCALGLAALACSPADDATSPSDARDSTTLDRGTRTTSGSDAVAESTADIPPDLPPRPEVDFGELEIDCPSAVAGRTCSVGAPDGETECTVKCALESPCPPVPYTWDGATSHFRDHDGDLTDEDWACAAAALAGGAPVRIELNADDTYIFGGSHYATVIWRLQPDVIVTRRRRSYTNDVGDSEYSRSLRAVALDDGAIASCLARPTAREQFFCVFELGDDPYECAPPAQLFCPAD